MSGYTQRVRDSILPLSVAGTLPAAFAEWAFIRSTIDRDALIETCESCGQQDLRYHFEVANRYTEATLWIGMVMRCPLRAGILLDMPTRVEPSGHIRQCPGLKRHSASEVRFKGHQLQRQMSGIEREAAACTANDLMSAFTLMFDIGAKERQCRKRGGGRQCPSWLGLPLERIDPAAIIP